MTWIQTRGGGRFDLLEPDPGTILIEDIAHALSNLCRFTGHTSAFMSVAEHSVIVSRLVPAHDALAGLLHDATEAYVGDVSRPLKQLLPAYQHIEHGIWLAIADRFGLDQGLPATVKEADNVSLLWERRDVMGPSSEPWQAWVPEELVSRVPDEILVPTDPLGARSMFLQRFAELTS